MCIRDRDYRYWYAPGYISAWSGCCHCDASCDHALESGADCSYYDQESSEDDAPVDDDCTPGWHSVKCLDDGTVMRGDGCTSCGDCAMYDYTAATGGRATCKLHGPDGSYSYSYSHSYSYSYGQGVTATYYFDGAEFPVPGECWYDDCDDDSDECAVHGLGPEYAKARPDGTPCDPGCECCRADGGCGECASDHVCEFAGDYGYCTSCEAKFPGDDGLIEYCRNEAGDGFDWDGTHYDNSCTLGDDCTPGYLAMECRDDRHLWSGHCGAVPCGEDCQMTNDLTTVSYTHLTLPTKA